MKNVVFWIGVKSDNKDLIKLKDYGNWDWMEYSKKTWEFWCKKNNVEFVHYDKTSNPDVMNHLVNWQRWFDVFDFLDNKKIDYDQILLVDASSMVHYNAPNFFDISERKWCAFRANENMKWTMESTDGYKDLFPGVEFRYNDYFATGLAIFNKDHKPALEELKKFYDVNYDKIIEKQKTVKRGTDQPVINYILRKYNVEIKHLRLPYACNHLYRREMLIHNWQLNEDMTPFFLKYLHLWFFSGLSDRGESRTHLMSQTWSVIGQFYDENFILNKVQTKDTYVKTTTFKFKEDLLKIFGNGNFKSKTVLEIGCCRGDTSRILSEVFGKVIAVDNSQDNINDAISKYSNCSNIEFICADAYKEFSYPEQVDVILIDASHEENQVYTDIEFFTKKYNSPIMILDDFGNGSDIRNAVIRAEENGVVKVSRYIGENVGYTAKRLNGEKIVFTGAEGVILNL